MHMCFSVVCSFFWLWLRIYMFIETLRDLDWNEIHASWLIGLHIEQYKTFRVKLIMFIGVDF
jgi:hypothetical protein